MDRDQVLLPAIRHIAKRPLLSKALNPLLAPYNPFDAERRIDPYPGYQLLRNAGPVMYHERLRGFLVTGYEEVEAILRSPRVSVDRRTQMLEYRPYNQLDPEVAEFFSNWLIAIDPPDHTRLRRLVSRAFTPRSVERLEPSVIAITDELLDGLFREARANDAPIDVMTRFADVLPIHVIGSLLGIPAEDWPWLKEVSDEIVRFIDPINAFDPRSMNARVHELSAYFMHLVDVRRNDPADDLITRLIEAEAEGDTLTRTELISMVSLVMGAGHETTTGLIGNALLALDQQIEARSLLVTRTDLDDNAVEELLRFDSPVQVTQRTALEDLTIGGVVIPAGSDLTLLLGAANRDPRRYRSPGALLLDREDPRPMSFGYGIHHCVGAALARMEGRIAIGRFVHAFPGYSVDRASVEFKPTITLRGPRTLPVFLN